MLQVSQQYLQKKQGSAIAVLSILCYLLTAAIVPPGHMAASLSSGTAFHLCPGDARSSLIIDALVAATAVNPDAEESSSAGHQHGSHVDHNGESRDGKSNGHGAGHETGISETSADPGCIFAGLGSAVAGNFSSAINEELPAGVPPSIVARAAYRSGSWLRPPARSPPV